MTNNAIENAGATSSTNEGRTAHSSVATGPAAPPSPIVDARETSRTIETVHDATTYSATEPEVPQGIQDTSIPSIGGSPDGSSVPEDQGPGESEPGTPTHSPAANGSLPSVASLLYALHPVTAPLPPPPIDQWRSCQTALLARRPVVDEYCPRTSWQFTPKAEESEQERVARMRYLELIREERGPQADRLFAPPPGTANEEEFIQPTWSPTGSEESRLRAKSTQSRGTSFGSDADADWPATPGLTRRRELIPSFALNEGETELPQTSLGSILGGDEHAHSSAIRLDLPASSARSVQPMGPSSGASSSYVNYAGPSITRGRSSVIHSRSYRGRLMSSPSSPTRSALRGGASQPSIESLFDLRAPSRNVGCARFQGRRSTPESMKTLGDHEEARRSNVATALENSDAEGEEEGENGDSAQGTASTLAPHNDSTLKKQKRSRDDFESTHAITLSGAESAVSPNAQSQWDGESHEENEELDDIADERIASVELLSNSEKVSPSTRTAKKSKKWHRFSQQEG